MRANAFHARNTMRQSGRVPGRADDGGANPFAKLPTYDDRPCVSTCGQQSNGNQRLPIENTAEVDSVAIARRWEPIKGLSQPLPPGATAGMALKDSRAYGRPRIVPSNRDLRIDGPYFRRSAIRPHSSNLAKGSGFLTLLTAFSLGPAAPNRQSGCDNRGLQRAFPPTLSIPEEASSKGSYEVESHPGCNPAEGILGERETETANSRPATKAPHSPPLGGPQRRIWLKVWSMRLCWVREDVPRPRIGADQGDFSESRMGDGLLTNRRISQANRSSESAPSG
jgi:hypothetical protein